MSGKNKCKILREIRKRIAEENSIELITAECKHRGNCPGTCPKCEEELRFLEKELRKRWIAGGSIAIAGAAAAILAANIGYTHLENWLKEITDTPQGFLEPSYTSNSKEQPDSDTPSYLLFDE